MRADRIHPGDEVTCNVRGRRFTAKVVKHEDDGTIAIEPPARVTYRHVTPRQVEKVHRWDPSKSQHTG